MNELLNDIIGHIEHTGYALECTYAVINALGEDYDANVDLIQGLLYYSYDLMGM
jgi:hypothetical protein